MKLGIVTPAYITQERHDISLAWTYSMALCAEYIPSGLKVKHVIIDDCSPCGQDIYELYYNYAKHKPNFKVEVIGHTLRYGKWALNRNFLEGISALKDCDFIISIPDDVIINQHLFEVIKKTYKYLAGNVKAITYFKDVRRDIWGGVSGGQFNDWFNYVSCCDGFILLASRETYTAMIQRVDEKAAEAGHTTMVWRNANNYLAGYKILEYKESLAQHIGNSFSAMVGAPRNTERYIYAKDINLFNKPGVLIRGKRTEYIPSRSIK